MLFVSGGKVIHKQVRALPEGMLRQVLDTFLSTVATLTSPGPGTNNDACA
jgi:hypothetical protein